MRTVAVQQPQQQMVQPVYRPVVVDTTGPIIRTISSSILVSSMIQGVSHDYLIQGMVLKKYDG